MKDIAMSQCSTCDPLLVELSGKKIADITITHHALDRWMTRVRNDKTKHEICSFVWDKLKGGKISPYYRNEEDVYAIDDDLLMVVQFATMDSETDAPGNPVHRMIVVTFLGSMSNSIELRDLRTYYAWLRHSRRMTLLKNSRKRR